MATLESALLIPIPEADDVVGQWRERLDHAASLGVPAHVTVLYPFVPPSNIDRHVTTEVAAIAAATPPFDYSFSEVRWFGTDVAWMEPDDDQPFRDLTEAFSRRWPSCPPYGGVYEDVIPHLTIAQHGPLHDMEAAADTVSEALPVVGAARELWLMAGSDQPRSWRVEAMFTLGAQ